MIDIYAAIIVGITLFIGAVPCIIYRKESNWSIAHIDNRTEEEKRDIKLKWEMEQFQRYGRKGSPYVRRQTKKSIIKL